MLERVRAEQAGVREREADVPLDVALLLQQQMMEEHGRQCWIPSDLERQPSPLTIDPIRHTIRSLVSLAQ